MGSVKDMRRFLLFAEGAESRAVGDVHDVTRSPYPEQREVRRARPDVDGNDFVTEVFHEQRCVGTDKAVGAGDQYL